MSEGTESRTGYVLGAMINAALLVVVHRLPEWNVAMITDEWNQVLYPVSVALGAQVVGNLFLAWHSNAFRHRVLHIIFDFTSIAALWRMVRAFPFDFAPLGFAAGNTALRVLLYVALVGVFVGMVTNLVRLFAHLIEEKEAKQEQNGSNDESGERTNVEYDASAESGDQSASKPVQRNRDGGRGRTGESDDPYAEDE